MIMYVEKTSSSSFFGKMHYPTVRNSIKSIEGETLSTINDIIERSKWDYVEKFDASGKQTLVTFRDTGLVQGGGMYTTVVFRAIMNEEDGTIKGIWFYRANDAQPGGNFVLFRE